MTSKEFEKLPAEVRQVIEDMGIDIADLEVLAHEHGGMVVGKLFETKNGENAKEDADAGKAFDEMMGMSEADGPMAGFVQFLHDIVEDVIAQSIIEKMQDDEDDDEDCGCECPMSEFSRFYAKYPREIEMMSEKMQKKPHIADEAFAEMFDVPLPAVTLTRAFTASAGPVAQVRAEHEGREDEKPFIVPVTGLLKVYAANEVEALQAVHMAVDEGYSLPVDHSCLPEVEDVYGATLAYHAGDIAENDIDGQLGGPDEPCPFHEMCGDE